MIAAVVPALAGARGRLYLDSKSPNGPDSRLGFFAQIERSPMTLPLSTPQPSTRTSAPGNRLARAVVAGGAGLGVVLLLVAATLWLRYGSAVFFEMIASGFAACF